ncbi:MAG: HAD-IIIC family phosphatase [Candidatus Krumholzibacteriota bacterium]|nr:HAD-IIIC family phosphatase [Candidatus Krumholzibacteriota bacterium]
MGNIKCVIWDLDNTIWEGICLEDPDVKLRPGIKEVLQEIGSRGIVQSIASKNEEKALDFVEKFGIGEFFVYPQVNWEPKEDNIRKIAGILNIGLDSVAFVDDNPFERESVEAMASGVRTYDAADYLSLTGLPEMQLKYDTPEARLRGKMYVDESVRMQEQAGNEEKKEKFLKSLGMVATPRFAEKEDLTRICELVTRTNQFNSTGIRYSDAQIGEFFNDPGYRFHIVSLTDKYGDYGRCGVALISQGAEEWNLEILLLSCRVAGRGLGSSFLSYLSESAKNAGARRFRAKYIKTDRNRQIGLLYKILGFSKNRDLSDDELSVFEYDLDSGPIPQPDWIRLETPK